MEPDEQLATIIPMLTAAANKIEPVRLNDATPCSEFTVTGVLGHMTALATGFAPMFLGVEPTDAADGQVPDDPDADADLIADFVQAMDGLLAAVQSPGALDRTIQTPGGEMPGRVFARLVALDGLVHGWDLATATAQSWDPPEDLVAEVDGFARQAISSEMREGGAFGPERTASGTTPMQALAAFTGRIA